MSWKKLDPTRTLHKKDCKRVFNRKDMSCARCIELANGAPAREGWSDHKRHFEAQSLAALKAHDCKVSRCSVVCTFGDW